MLSLLACNNLTCEVQGIYNLQATYEQTYGPGNYIPPVAVVYWAFRGMFVSGMVMVLIALVGLYLLLRSRLERTSWFLRLLPLAIFLSYLANSSGWILTEVGRQPWIVFGLMKTLAAVSPGVSPWGMLFSLLAFTLIYGVLMAVDIYLLARYARKGTAVEDEAPALAVA